MNIRTYLKDLLYLHDCVIIPDFGGFVTGYQSSEIQRFKNLVYPPSKSIQFNRRLQSNDGILISYIAQLEKIAYSEAERQVKQFSAWWNRKLENKGVVVFPDVGKLYINSNNVLVFLPELRKNYLLDTFGLKPIAFHPQLEAVSMKDQKKLSTEPLDEAEYADRLRIKRKRRTQLIAAAAVIAAVLFILPQLFLQNLLPEQVRIEQLNVLNIFKAENETVLPKDSMKEVAEIELPVVPEIQEHEGETIIETEIESEAELEAEVSDEAEVPSAPVGEKPVTEIAVTGNYYVILGAFDFISDAIRAKKKLDNQYGKTMDVFSSEDGNYLVGITAGNSKQEAESILDNYASADHQPSVYLRE